MKRARIAFVLSLIFAVTCATFRAAPRASGLMLAPGAWAVANSTYARSQLDDAEAGLCVAPGAWRWGWAPDGKMWVEIAAFATRGPQAAQIMGSGRYWVMWRNFCGDTLPALHTHIGRATAEPSSCDLQGAARRPRVPFYLIQFAHDSISLYYLDPEQRRHFANDSIDYCAPH